MVKVTLNYVAYPTTDYYDRYFGRAIDQTLLPDFWVVQPEKVIGVWSVFFSYTETVELTAGTHVVTFGGSGYCVEYDYKWYGSILANGKFEAKGCVARDSYIKANITIGEEVPPPEGETIWDKIKKYWWLIVAAIASGGAGYVAGVKKK